MKRIISILLAVAIIATSASAQTTDIQTADSKFAIKVQPFFGTYLDKGNHHFKKLGLENLSGMNLGIEFPSEQQRPWQQ